MIAGASGPVVQALRVAKRDLDAAKRFFRKMLRDEPLMSPRKIGTDGANTFPTAIKSSVADGLLNPGPAHYVTKHLQQGIESDHFRVKKNMPKIGGYQSFKTARRTIAGSEAMLWLRMASVFPANGPSTIKTICLRSSSDFKRLTNRDNAANYRMLRAPEELATGPFGLLQFASPHPNAVVQA